jgi:hypothetical protein
MIQISSFRVNSMIVANASSYALLFKMNFPFDGVQVTKDVILSHFNPIRLYIFL